MLLRRHLRSLAVRIAALPDHCTRPRRRTRTHAFVRGGELYVSAASGDKHRIEFEALGESGFFLRTAGYGDWAGHKHGSWMGSLHVDGEYIADWWSDENLPLLGQLRDTSYL